MFTGVRPGAQRGDTITYEYMTPVGTLVGRESVRVRPYTGASTCSALLRTSRFTSTSLSIRLISRVLMSSWNGTGLSAMMANLLRI